MTSLAGNTPSSIQATPTIMKIRYPPLLLGTSTALGDFCSNPLCLSCRHYQKKHKKKKRNWQNKRSKSCFKWLTGKTFIDVTWEMVLDSNYFGGNLKSSSRIHCRYKLFITRATASFFFVAMKTGTLPITGTQICSAIKNDMNENDECLIPPLSRRLFPDGLEGKFCTQSFKGIQAMAVAAKKKLV